MLPVWLGLAVGCHDKEADTVTNTGVVTAPSGLAFSAPDGRMTFFSMEDGHFIGTRTLGAWSVAHAAFNLQGDLLVVTDGAHSRVVGIRMSDLNEVVSRTIAGIPTDLQVSSSGAQAYVTTQNSILWVCSMSSGHVDTMEVGPEPRRARLRPPSDVELWVACKGDNTLRIVELQSLHTIDTLHFAQPATAIAFSPDGVRGYIAVQGSPGLVWVVDGQTREAYDFLDAGLGPFELAISGDGRYLAAADSATQRTRIWDLHTSQVWNVSTGGPAERIRYSQSTGAFFVCMNAQNSVVKIDISGETPMVTDTIAIAPELRELVVWEPVH
jgi:DNA-binding beta-propeller fold protein YncE